MNINETIQLKNLIDQIISSKSRNNQAKPSKYWHPLSLASFGSDEILEALDSMCSFRTSMAEKTLFFEKINVYFLMQFVSTVLTISKVVDTFLKELNSLKNSSQTYQQE